MVRSTFGKVAVVRVAANAKIPRAKNIHPNPGECGDGEVRVWEGCAVTSTAEVMAVPRTPPTLREKESTAVASPNF